MTLYYATDIPLKEKIVGFQNLVTFNKPVLPDPDHPENPSRKIPDVHLIALIYSCIDQLVVKSQSLGKPPSYDFITAFKQLASMYEITDDEGFVALGFPQEFVERFEPMKRLSHANTQNQDPRIAQIKAIYENGVIPNSEKMSQLHEWHNQNVLFGQDVNGVSVAISNPLLHAISMSYQLQVDHRFIHADGRFRMLTDISSPIKSIIQQYNIQDNAGLIALGFCPELLEWNNFFSSDPNDQPCSYNVQLQMSGGPLIFKAPSTPAFDRARTEMRAASGQPGRSGAKPPTDENNKRKFT